jgi:TatA/E family protein of Tat protein translocase
MPLALGMPAVPELIVIAVIGLMVFGKRLPEVSRGIGQSMAEFGRAVSEANFDGRLVIAVELILLVALASLVALKYLGKE